MATMTKLPITEPHMLVNLIGEAVSEAAEKALRDPRYGMTTRADLYWSPIGRRFVVLPREPRGWGKVGDMKGEPPWDLKADPAWVSCWALSGDDLRNGLTSQTWWRVFSRVGVVLERRGDFRGPWPRLDFVE